MLGQLGVGASGRGAPGGRRERDRVLLVVLLVLVGGGDDLGRRELGLGELVGVGHRELDALGERGDLGVGRELAERRAHVTTTVPVIEGWIEQW